MGDTGQVTQSAAEVYDELFPAALFNEWSPRVAKLAGVKPGIHVLDVACGTGVLSLVAADLAKPLEYDADLLFRGELATRAATDLPHWGFSGLLPFLAHIETLLGVRNPVKCLLV